MKLNSEFQNRTSKKIQQQKISKILPVIIERSGVDDEHWIPILLLALRGLFSLEMWVKSVIEGKFKWVVVRIIPAPIFRDREFSNPEKMWDFQCCRSQFFHSSFPCLTTILWIMNHLLCNIFKRLRDYWWSLSDLVISVAIVVDMLLLGQNILLIFWLRVM